MVVTFGVLALGMPACVCLEALARLEADRGTDRVHLIASVKPFQVNTACIAPSPALVVRFQTSSTESSTLGATVQPK